MSCSEPVGVEVIGSFLTQFSSLGLDVAITKFITGTDDEHEQRQLINTAIQFRLLTIVLVSHDFMVLSSYIKSVACVSQQVFFHDAPEITKDMLQMAYHCPVELIAHGLPHRVLDSHSEE